MNTQRAQKEYNVLWFQKLAPFYDVIEIFVGHIRKKVANQIDLSPGAKILDMACGTGSQSIAFAKRGFSVVGIDLSPDMLARAKKKVKEGFDVTFVCQDAAKIPYKDSEFDASSISFGLHDMPEDVGIAVLAEMKRATKRGGKVVIVDYHKPKNRLLDFLGYRIAKIWETQHYDHFRKIGLGYYLDKVGLRVGERETFLFENAQIVTCINEK